MTQKAFLIMEIRYGHHPLCKQRTRPLCEQEDPELRPKSQTEIAAEAGFPNANFLSMAKTGVSKLAIDRVLALAQALECDPAFLMRLALEHEVGSRAAKALVENLGTPVSANERLWLAEIRDASGALSSFDCSGADGDPVCVRKASTSTEKRVVEGCRLPSAGPITSDEMKWIEFLRIVYGNALTAPNFEQVVQLRRMDLPNPTKSDGAIPPSSDIRCLYSPRAEMLEGSFTEPPLGLVSGLTR